VARGHGWRRRGGFLLGPHRAPAGAGCAANALEPGQPARGDQPLGQQRFPREALSRRRRAPAAATRSTSSSSRKGWIGQAQDLARQALGVGEVARAVAPGPRRSCRCTGVGSGTPAKICCAAQPLRTRVAVAADAHRVLVVGVHDAGRSTVDGATALEPAKAAS
jgi:hypothetical protein